MITRLEVIDETGRAYTNYNIEDISIDIQDNNRTLKIFIKSEMKQKIFEDLMLNWEDTPEWNKKLSKAFKGLIK